MKQYQHYNVTGGLQENVADSVSQPSQFTVLKNALPDKRLGAIVKRRGSAEATLTTGLSTPLGAGNLDLSSANSLIPYSGSRLFNFGGTAWWKLVGTTYSSVSATADTSFGSERPTSMSQLGTNLFIAGGRPAYWDGTNDIDRVGIPSPPYLNT